MAKGTKLIFGTAALWMLAACGGSGDPDNAPSEAAEDTAPAADAAPAEPAEEAPVAVAAPAEILPPRIIPEGCGRYAIMGDIRPAPGERAGGVLITGDRVEAVIEEGGAIPDDLNPACQTGLPAGAVVFAGLTDGHAHLIGIGLREMDLNLEGTSSIEDLKARIQVAAADLAPGETLYGRGWIETGWPEGRMPTAADLDEAVGDRPVILARADGHAAVVNSIALEEAGITYQTPDPDGGRIEKDENGQVTGLLIDHAEELVADLLPVLTEERRRAALIKGAQVYADRGWTGLHNMSVDPEDAAILTELADAGELPIRVMSYLVPEELDAMLESGPTCTENNFACTLGVKFYIDGALGSRGALLFRPYSDAPDTSGLALMTVEEALDVFQRAADSNIQVAAHAIGDKGNFHAIDWFRRTLGKQPDRRWRLEHAQILRPNDIPRVAFYGLIPSMQPSHAIGDLYFAPDRLGDDRLFGAYAWKSFAQTGAKLVGGSDAPVEVGDPRIEIHAATKRTTLDGYSAENWHPEEAVSPDEALAMFTTNAAYAVFMEEELGILKPGAYADLTIFSADPFTAEQWDEPKVLATLVGGRASNRTAN